MGHGWGGGLRNYHFTRTTAPCQGEFYLQAGIWLNILLQQTLTDTEECTGNRFGTKFNGRIFFFQGDITVLKLDSKTIM